MCHTYDRLGRLRDMHYSKANVLQVTKFNTISTKKDEYEKWVATEVDLKVEMRRTKWIKYQDAVINEYSNVEILPLKAWGAKTRASITKET